MRLKFILLVPDVPPDSEIINLKVTASVRMIVVVVLVVVLVV